MTQDMNKYAALDYDFSVPNINCASLMCYKRGQPDMSDQSNSSQTNRRFLRV